MCKPFPFIYWLYTTVTNQYHHMSLHHRESGYNRIDAPPLPQHHTWETPTHVWHYPTAKCRNTNNDCQLIREWFYHPTAISLPSPRPTTHLNRSWGGCLKHRLLFHYPIPSSVYSGPPHTASTSSVHNHDHCSSLSSCATDTSNA
jgi:hypothetical protein